MSVKRAMQYALWEAGEQEPPEDFDPEATPETTGEPEYENPQADVGEAMKAVLQSVAAMAKNLNQTVTKGLKSDPDLSDLEHLLTKTAGIVIAMYDFLEENMGDAEEDDEDDTFDDEAETEDDAEDEENEE